MLAAISEAKESMRAAIFSALKSTATGRFGVLDIAEDLKNR
jgi:hypothetical protein